MNSAHVTAATLLEQVAHRPWPLPRGPWILEQSWHDVLFAHWSLDFHAVRGRVPAAFELDTFDQRAWVSVVAFRIDPLRTRWLPLELRFPELNLRTYVRVQGKPGVYFFSLDAASRTAVVGARALFRLNYFNAAISFGADTDFDFVSRRLERPYAKFEAHYHMVAGELSDGVSVDATAREGAGKQIVAESLNNWLVERYCLYAARPGGASFRVDIHHPPWNLRPAQAELDVNELFFAAQLPAPNSAPLLHYAARQDTLTWAPERV